MKKKITLYMGLMMALFLLPINTFAYTINDEYNLALNQGDYRLAILTKLFCTKLE